MSGLNQLQLATATKALEELRMADAQLLAALGELEGVRLGAALDLIGLGDIDHSGGTVEGQEALLLARDSVQSAVDLLRLERTGESGLLSFETSLEGIAGTFFRFFDREDLWEPISDAVWLRRAHDNKNLIHKTRAAVRDLFTRVLSRDRRLERRVQPLLLEEDDDGGTLAAHAVGVSPSLWGAGHYLVIGAGLAVLTCIIYLIISANI